MVETRSARVSVRITPAGKQQIESLAQQTGHDQSEIARMLLAYGLQNMPPPPTKERHTL